MKKYKVRLEGEGPLLHGRKDPREGTAPRAEPDRTEWYDKQWKYTHYANGVGVLGQPGHVLKAVIVAGMRETAKAGDVKAGKGKTEQMARACLRIEPAFPKFNNGAIMVPDSPDFLDPSAAQSLELDETKVFVLKRLCDRGWRLPTLLSMDGTLTSI